MRHAIAASARPLLCAALAACGEPKLECESSAVIGTLSSMVRDRVRRVVEDGYPASFDAAKRARLTKATRVSPQAMRLVEWDANSGQLTCVARIVVAVPVPRPIRGSEAEIELRYRVTREDADTFLVEIGYAEMMSLSPVRRGVRAPLAAMRYRRSGAMAMVPVRSCRRR